MSKAILLLLAGLSRQMVPEEGRSTEMHVIYEAGMSNVTDLLRNETAVLESRTRYLAAAHDQRIAATVLELAAGRLTRNSYIGPPCCGKCQSISITRWRSSHSGGAMPA